jgi:PAS domain S-box-containing protein
MNRSSWIDSAGVEGVPEVLWDDGERRFYRIWRRGTDGKRQRCLAVLPSSEHPAPGRINQLVHEHELKDHLDGTWALRPLELLRDRGAAVLLLEYHRGEPLDRLIVGPMEIGAFLRIALALAAAISRLHERGLIHKDIKPANILVDPSSKRVWLMGFHVASRLRRERQSPDPPELIAGTLSHMAPEQTGRMNRSIDSRSDLYSMGVTLYQALTGKLPFTASDPMEWVHCHIARKPVTVETHRGNVPSQLSAIVMKLLAKTPEERYQTASGVERDLRRCLSEWETRRVIGEFALGEHDCPDRLLIPERLYGRESEIAILVSAFDEVVASGTPSLVLVSGNPGIGKSSVVNELHKVLVPPSGQFASGKFDQLKRDVPYSTLAQAFRSLIHRLLSKPEIELSTWRAEAREALEPNGALLIGLIPELEFVIGEQPAVPELSPSDAKARFQLALRRLIGVFARAEHPLALFLDDLQWLDVATLDLLEDVLVQQDLHYVLLIGAYRDTEVDASHPLKHKIAAIREKGAVVREIVLGSLNQEDLTYLIADAAHCEPHRAIPLAELVHQKTAGNPFFANQFIQELADEGAMRFDAGQSKWVWDLRRIQAKGYTDNVIDLMAAKLSRLPSPTQEALIELSCVGNSAKTSFLAIIHGTSAEQVDLDLWEARRTELVVRSEDGYRFAHDRIQEAAYSLLSEEQQALAHLRIGRLLTAHIADRDRHEAIFDIVGQLNRGSILIASPDEREQLADLNLVAGKRAKAAAAWASALNYLVAGIALMPKDGWERRQNTIFELELHRAECEFLTGEITSAEAHLATLSSHAADVVQKAAVGGLVAEVQMALQRPERGFAECLECLRGAGLDIPLHPSDAQAQAAYDQICSKLDGIGIDDLAAQPLIADPTSRAVLDLIAKVLPSALTIDKNLMSLLVCAGINLSLERGHCDSSCYAYSYLGFAATWYFGEFEAGFRYGWLGYELVQRKGLRKFEALVVQHFSTTLMRWSRPIATCHDFIRTGFDIANQTGNRSSGVWCACEIAAGLLFAGEPLGAVDQEAEACLEFCRRAAFSDYVDRANILAAFVRNLRGLTRRFGYLGDERFNELRIQNHFETEPHVLPCEVWYWVRILQARFFAGDYAAALDASIRAQGRLATAPSQLELVEYELFSALTRAALCDSASSDDRRGHLSALASHLRQLESWARHCPENFENGAALVAAEIARIEGRDRDAMELYERAIRSAGTNGFVQNEALALELASRFYVARGFDRIAKAYLRDARQGYLQWGADGKARQLDELYPHLTQADRRADPTRMVEAPVEHLDLAAVLKVLEAVSGEIDLEKLIGTVMRLGLEHAGAESGLLILPRGSAYRVEAEAGIGEDGITVALVESSVTAEHLPESAFHYVLRTREAVLLHDASSENAFSGDSYIRQRRPRSVLCMPLLKQTRLVGVLYLENSLASGVFSPARMTLLKLLASEAAISIENARLYRDLRERDARVRRMIDANIIGISIWHADGRISDANEEFLRIVGYSREDLGLGRLRWTDFSSPEFRERDLRALEEVRKGGGQKPEEREYVKKDGTRVPVLAGGAAFEGVPDEGVGFVIDLTEQKRAERALHESEREVRLVLETIPGLVATLTPTGQVDAVNRQLVEYCGQALQRLRHPDRNGAIHSEDLPRVAQLFTHSIASGEPYDFEARIRRFDGVYRWFQIRGLPFHDTSGQIVRWYVLLSDVDDRKRAESDLRLVQERFVDAQRLAALNTLTASIAHEVNQPLTGIVTNSSTCIRMLNADPPNVDGAREIAKRVIRDCQRASEVITRLRAMFSKKEVIFERVDLNQATQEVVALSLNDLQRNRVVLQLELAESLPSVMGDRVQLQQVILNLLRNASEAMVEVNDRSRQLVVRTETEGDSHVRFTVRDAGIGVEHQNLDKLFDSFFTTKEGGMGMGLSVSRSIIERHHGRLWVQPNDGPGATFVFSIPVASEAATGT